MRWKRKVCGASRLPRSIPESVLAQRLPASEARSLQARAAAGHIGPAPRRRLQSRGPGVSPGTASPRGSRAGVQARPGRIRSWSSPCLIRGKGEAIIQHWPECAPACEAFCEDFRKHTSRKFNYCGETMEALSQRAFNELCRMIAAKGPFGHRQISTERWKSLRGFESR
jgi:hypothetical protein